MSLALPNLNTCTSHTVTGCYNCHNINRGTIIISEQGWRSNTSASWVGAPFNIMTNGDAPSVSSL